MIRLRGTAACLLPLLWAVSGCSSSRLAVKFMTPVLDDTVEAALANGDAALVVDALPTSIILVDGMLRTSPGNGELARVGSLLNFAYAFAYVDAQQDSVRASGLYAHGRDLAWQALDRPRIEKAVRSGTFAELDHAVASLGKKDAESLLWICANWGMWIQLNLDDPTAAADLARLMPLAERLADLDDTLFWGMPRILLGAMDAGRPVMLGGNLDQARREFDRAFEISHRNLLIAQVFFAKTWCVQAFDAESFETSLREVIDAPPGLLPEAEFLNRIALLQARSLLARRDEIFD
jgi:TRAP transporter T-component